MQDLPLAPEHEAHAARFVDSGEWRVPLDYGDGLEEQRAVRRSVGVIDWSARGKIRVTGEDRLAFLDGLLTNDLKTLREGQGLYAATLDHKAHIHGDMIVYHVGDHYLLETDPETRDRVSAYLNKFLISDDVTLTDVTSEYAIFGIFGPRSGTVVARIFGELHASSPFDHVIVDSEGSPVRVARSAYFGGEGYEAWIPSGPVTRKLWRSILEGGAVPFGASAAEALRIEAGRPKFGADMDERTLALEARLEPAISMTKGCYVGQEIVSRAVYQGHVNRLLVGLELEGAELPAVGASIEREGKVLGAVTSTAASAWREKVLALGYVRRGSAEPGTEVLVGETRGRVVALPFYRG